MSCVRGIVGIGILLLSIILYCFNATKPLAPLLTGFGIGMITTGF